MYGYYREKLHVDHFWEMGFKAQKLTQDCQMDCFFFFAPFISHPIGGKGMWADLAICREFIRRFTPIPMVRGEK